MQFKVIAVDTHCLWGKFEERFTIIDPHLVNEFGRAQTLDVLLAQVGGCGFPFARLKTKINPTIYPCAPSTLAKCEAE